MNERRKEHVNERWKVKVEDEMAIWLTPSVYETEAGAPACEMQSDGHK